MKMGIVSFIFHFIPSFLPPFFPSFLLFFLTFSLVPSLETLRSDPSGCHASHSTHPTFPNRVSSCNGAGSIGGACPSSPFWSGREGGVTQSLLYRAGQGRARQGRHRQEAAPEQHQSSTRSRQHFQQGRLKRIPVSQFTGRDVGVVVVP